MKPLIHLPTILVLLFVIACTPPSTKDDSTVKPFKLGVISTLTGPSAWIGENMGTAVLLAVEDVNAQGGINGRPIEMILEDATDPAKAATAAQKLINQDGVDAIYAITTPVTAGASTVADNYQIPLMAFTGVQEFAKKHNWVFSDLRDSDHECTILSKAMLANGDKNVAVLGNDADFTVSCIDALQREFVPQGGLIITNEMKLREDPDARTPLTKIKAIKADALVLICWPADCNLIYRQMLELGMNPRLYLPLSIPLGSNPQSFKDLNKSVILRDAFGTEPLLDPDNPTPAFAAFKKTFDARLGKPSPFSADAAVAYDNIHQLAQAANTCRPVTSQCLKTNLEQTDYEGVAGKVQYKGKHTATRIARVIQYKDGRWQTYAR